MNRAQLAALLRAGLINQEQFTAASATLDAHDQTTVRPTLTLELAAENVSTDAASRTLHGLFCVYEQLIESHGIIMHAGSIEPRMPLNRFKVLRDHDHHDPLGYVSAFDADTLEGDLFIVDDADGNGNRALEEAQNGLRDGLSIGFGIREYEFDDDWIIHVHRAEVYEVSLCAIPAVADAGIYNVAAALAATRKENTIMNRAQLAAALAAGTITQEQHDAALSALDAIDLARPAAPAAEVDPALAAGPDLQTQQPAGPTFTRPRNRSLNEVVSTISAAFNTGDPRQVQMAISDVVPADDAGGGFLVTSDEGELWRASADTRPWIDAIGAPQELKALKGKGWRWGDADGNGDGGKPLVDEYAGNKTEVPSNKVGTISDDFTAFRIAAGWDVDRAFEDFADPEFTASFWAGAMSDYKRKSNAGIRTRVVAAATAGAATATTSIVAFLKLLITDVRGVEGGKANRVFLGDAAFSALEDLPSDNLPVWLKTASIGVDISEGTAQVGGLVIQHDGTLAAKQGVAFDSRAMVVREKSPLLLKALNIPNGGIDLGFFGYLRLDDTDDRVIVKRTTTGTFA